MDEVPTTARPRRLELRGGGHVEVRRLRRSVRDKLLQVAQVKEGDAGSAARFLQLVVRTAVVGAQGLTDPDTGQEVPYSTERHPALGRIASEQVYDALQDDKDLERIAAEAMPEAGITEAQAGN